MNMRKIKRKYYWPKGRRRYRYYGSFTVTFVEPINQIGLGVHKFFQKWIEATNITGNEMQEFPKELVAS